MLDKLTPPSSSLYLGGQNTNQQFHLVLLFLIDFLVVLVKMCNQSLLGSKYFCVTAFHSCSNVRCERSYSIYVVSNAYKNHIAAYAARVFRQLDNVVQNSLLCSCWAWYEQVSPAHRLNSFLKRYVSCLNMVWSRCSRVPYKNYTFVGDISRLYCLFWPLSWHLFHIDYPYLTYLWCRKDVQNV